jgi:hypothetical protein
MASSSGFQLGETSADILFYELDTSSLTLAPQFSEDTFRMPTETAKTATYTLSNAYASPTAAVYDSDSASTPSSGVVASLAGIALTLTFNSPPTADTTYYLSVKDGELTESALVSTPFNPVEPT